MPPVHFMQELGALRRELMDAIREGISEVARWSLVSASSSTGESDAVEGWGLADEPSSQQRTRRVEPWGLRGRPAVGITAAVLRVFGRAAQSLLLGTGGERYGRQDLAVGETQLYCGTDGTEIYLDSNGKMQINAATSQDIAVNVSGTGKITINCAAGGTVLVNGNGITDQQVALATVDVAGGYPITAAAPRRFKAGVT